MVNKDPDFKYIKKAPPNWEELINKWDFKYSWNGKYLFFYGWQNLKCLQILTFPNFKEARLMFQRTDFYLNSDWILFWKNGGKQIKQWFINNKYAHPDWF